MTTPKVACTTVKRTLHAFEGLLPPADVGEVHEEGRELCLSAFGEDQVVAMLCSGDWLRFAFVRNPYDRLYSAWKSKIRNPADTQYRPLRHRIRTELGYPDPGDGHEPVIAFGDFVRFVVAATDEVQQDAHWDLQVNVLCHGLIPYDVIGRFETFAADFTAILHRLDAPEHVVALASEVTNATRQAPLGTGYDEALATLVHDYYRADFDTFGYPPRPPGPDGSSGPR